MKLTKHAHACVTLDNGSGRIVVDPGTFTQNAAALLADADAVLITHEHFDHFDEKTLANALEARPDLRIYAPAPVAAQLRGERVTAVADGDRFDVAGFEIAVHGDTHALIHRDIPRVTNIGFLVDGDVYHPGDSYHVPPAPVRTLLLPTSGPWTKFGEAADFVREVSPETVIQIHEVMLSEIGQQSMARFISPEMLTKVPLTILPAGDDITV